MLLDTEQNLWLATYEGLFNLFGRQFVTYTPAEDIDKVRSVLADDKGNIWAGMMEAHLYRIKDDVQYEAPIPRQSGVSYLQGVAAIQKDAMYFPGGDGKGDVLRYKDGKGQWMRLEPLTYSLSEALPDGHIMLGAYSGLAIYDVAGKKLKEWDWEELYLHPFVTQADKMGKIWVGGSHGLSVIDGDSVRLLSAPDGFLGCRAVAIEPSGTVWASSRNSLYTVENDTLTRRYTFTDNIRSVYFTRNNLLIVATLRGIHIKRANDTNFLYYDRNNGFPDEKIIPCKMAEDTEGNIWALTDKCMVRFNPENLLQEQPVPKLYVQSVKRSTDNINWHETEESQGKYEFEYFNKNIQFSYIGLSFSASDNVRYQYRLSGFQNEWSLPQSAKEVTFNNLPPGSYVFQLKADAGTTETETAEISIPFTIHPAFWQTTWFILVALLSLMLASAGIALFYQRRKNKVLFERLETEKQLNELRIKSIRLKAIPHFNANVLAAIEYYIMNLSKTEALRLLGIYSRFTFQTLREVDRASRSLNEELEYVKMYLELEKLRFVNKFDYKIDVDETVDADNLQLPNMILHTYCENAVKHGLSSKHGDGVLIIKITQSDNLVCVSVEDNGVGREAAARNKNVPSSKQGLDILSRQIEIYNRFNTTKINRKIDDLYTDGQPSGTRFTVEVPYGFVYQ
jgi:hypothetical protein